MLVNSIKSFLKAASKKPIIFIDKFILSAYLRAVKDNLTLQELNIQNKRVLILSPHEDDETLGCGCLIQKLIEGGCAVKCAFMTDGRNSLSFIYDKAAMAKVREEEACTVSDFFSMEAPVFLRCPDGELSSEEPYIEKLENIIRDFEPDYIFLPYFLDALRDHCATSGLLLSALDRIEDFRKIQYFAYEINNPISVYGITHYIDCSPYLKKKSAALELYESQIMSFDSILLMNKLNALLVPKKCTGIELFKRLDIECYRRAYMLYNGDNSIYKSFRPMYSIYFMLAAYFKGIKLKKQVADFLAEK